MSSVGYLTKRFPRLSETFILGEILGLEAAGVNLRLFAIADAHESTVQPDVALVRSPVTYLRQSGWRRALLGAGATLSAHGRLLRRAPGRYLSVVLYIAARRRHLSTLRHFLEAGRLAVLLERDGATRVHAAFAHGPATVAHFVHLLTGLTFSFAAHAKDLYLSPADLLARKVADADFVLVCSDGAAQTLRQLAGPASSKIVLAHHGVDTSRFAPAGPGTSRGNGLTAAPGTLAILAVGRLVPKKGYPVLLAALAQALAAGHRVALTIIGDGTDRASVQELVKQLGIGSAVVMAGAQTQPQVAAALINADVFVQASVVLANGDRDGIPNALLEAMAAGVPVVASTVGGIPEVVEDGVSGLLVEPGDPGALAAAFGRLIEDPSLRTRLGMAARAHAVKSLDRAVCAQRIAPLFGAPGPAPASTS